jgi:alkanesulfonate monooxygenase SsuD/methylene tetrahydromethanopterin reductase-like flavin-dependent oxidoreductase (luciferase family)
MKLGVLLLEEDLASLCSLAEQAEAAAVDSVWTIEYYNRNSVVRAAAMAARTRRLRVGTAITAAFARAPLMLATAAADLSTLAPGRVVLGLGTGTARMNSDWYGTPADHPASRLEELIAVQRRFNDHHSGPFSHEGRFVGMRFAHLDRQPAAQLPIYTAGVNPRMVEVAGRSADGFIGHPVATAEYLEQIAEPAIAKGLLHSGRATTAVRRVTQVITALDHDRAAARRRAAMQIAFYATVKTYEVIFRLHGFGAERSRIRDAFLAGDSHAMADAVSDDMLARMAAYGTPAEVDEQLARYSGWADELILYPPHFGVTSTQLHDEQLDLIAFVSARVSLDKKRPGR